MQPPESHTEVEARPDDPVDIDATPPTEPASDDSTHGSLRGTFVAVVFMAAFFVVTWFGMFLLAMDRR